MKKRLISFMLLITVISCVGFNTDYFKNLLTLISQAAKEVIYEETESYDEETSDSAVDRLEQELEKLDVRNFFEDESETESGSNFKGQLYNGTRNPDVDFVNSKGKSTLNKHAAKHGYTSPEEYLKDARNFLEKKPTSTIQSFVSNEGTYFRYDTMTNEFGIINEYGGISTYFKPENGIVYWLEQIEKYAPK